MNYPAASRRVTKGVRGKLLTMSLSDSNFPKSSRVSLWALSDRFFVPSGLLRGPVNGNKAIAVAYEDGYRLNEIAAHLGVLCDGKPETQTVGVI